MKKELTRDQLIAVVDFVLNGMDSTQLLQLSQDITHKRTSLQNSQQTNNFQTTNDTNLCNGLEFLDVMTKTTLNIRFSKAE